VTPHLTHWFRLVPLIRWTLVAQTVFGAILMTEVASGRVSPPYLLPVLFAFQTCTGIVSGPAIVVALHEHGSVAGAASALMMCVIVGFGALGSAFVALLADGTAMPMAAVIGVGSACALAMAMLIRDEGPDGTPPTPAPDELLH
jgi:DHA1 family bicyclomycin/chloramphenicol resistance-like MFS transporter